MELLSTELRTHLENLARKAGTEAALEAIAKINPPQPQERKRNLIDGKRLSVEIGISPSTIIRHRNRGLFEGFRIGGRVLYDLDSVLESMQSTRRRK